MLDDAGVRPVFIEHVQEFGFGDQHDVLALLAALQDVTHFALL